MKLLARLYKAKAENPPQKNALLQVRIDEDTLNKLDAICMKIQKSRPWVVRQLLIAASTELKEHAP